MKIAASKVAWAGIIASMMVLLAAVLAGCSGEEAAASPRARDDRATTVEGREVMIGMVVNDTGESLQIDGFEPGERMAASSARFRVTPAQSNRAPTRLQRASPARTSSSTR